MLELLKTAQAADAQSVVAAAGSTAATAGILHALGVDLAIATAGAFGAGASLAYLRTLTARVAICSVLAGTGSAIYLTALVAAWIQKQLSMEGDPKLAVAFLLGLGGMNLVGGIVAWWKCFRKDPVNTTKELQ
jgi:hypothetical protein